MTLSPAPIETTTMWTHAEDALHAHRARQEAHAQAEEARQAQALEILLGLIGVHAAPTRPRVTLDGVTFVLVESHPGPGRIWQQLRLELPCPTCGTLIQNGADVRTAAILGEHLEAYRHPHSHDYFRLWGRFHECVQAHRPHDPSAGPTTVSGRIALSAPQAPATA